MVQIMGLNTVAWRVIKIICENTQKKVNMKTRIKQVPYLVKFSFLHSLRQQSTQSSQISPSNVQTEVECL